MFVYHYRLFDRRRKPVVSLAVLADLEAAWRPRTYRYLLRQVRRRFGEAVAASSGPGLADIHDPAVLEDLGEALLDCADGATGSPGSAGAV
jgi:hypothetical protein